MASLSYQDLLQQHQRSAAFGDTRDLPTYSRDMNALTGSNDYDAGLKDNWLRRGSTEADIGLEGTVGSELGQVAKNYGDLGGFGEPAQHFAEKVPRMFADTAALFVPGLNGVAAAGITGAAIGAHTYADTGSVKAGVIAGAVGAALPAVSHLGGNVAARLAGAPLVDGVLAQTGERVSSVVPETWGQRAAQFGGSQLSQLTANAISSYGVERTVNPQDSYNPLTDSSFWLQNIPWTAFDAVGQATHPLAKASDLRAQLRTEPEPVPQPKTTPYVPPPTTAEQQANVEKLIQQVVASNDPSVDPQQRAALLAMAINGIQNPEGVQQAKAGVEAQGPSPLDQKVSITGFHNEPIEGNGHKVLVSDVSGPEGLQDLKGKTVWVNGVEPRRNDDGTSTFDAKVSDVSTNVTHPLRPEDFVEPSPTLEPRPKGVEPTGLEKEAPPVQGELPQRAEGMEPTTTSVEPDWSIPTSPADLANLGEMGVEPQETITPEIRSRLEQFEAAKQTEKAAREATSVVPQTAEDVVKLVPEAAKPVIEERLKDGATASQAVESTRLATHTPEVDSALTDQAIAKQEVTQKIQVRKTSMLNEKGQRFYFDSPSKAMEFLDEYKRTHTEDTRPWHVATRKDRGKEEFFLDSRLTQQNRELSIQASTQPDRGELAGAMADYQHEGEESRGGETMLSGLEAPIEQRDSIGLSDAMKTLEKASKEPKVFSSVTGLDPIDTMRALSRAKVMLGEKTTSFEEANRALRNANVSPFKDVAEYRKHQQVMLEGLHEFNGRFRSATLGSSIPYDEALVQESGVRQGTKPFVSWLAKQDLGLFSDFARAYEKMPHVLDNVRLILPGDADFQSNWGSFYNNNEHDPAIQMGFLPTKATSIEWARTAIHEFTHHFDNNLEKRTDPAAVEFKKTRTQVLKLLQKSDVLPKEVRDLISQAIKENHYLKYSLGEISVNDLNDQWMPKLGEKNKSWYPVVYGLLNEREMMAQAFSSPKFVNLMLSTEMPKAFGPVRSVLNFFSEAWSKVFGNGVRPSALEALLSSYDNYLTGGVLKKTYNGADYIRESLLQQGTRPEALASRMDAVDRTYARGDLRPSITAFQREQENGLSPTTSSQGELHPDVRHSLLSGTPSEVHEKTMNLLAEQLPVHQELLQRMKQDVLITEGLLKSVEKGKTPGEVPAQTKLLLEASKKKLAAMSDAMSKQAKALEQFNDLNNFTQDGLDTTLAKTLIGGKLPAPPGRIDEDLHTTAQQLLGMRAESTRAELEGKGPNWFQRNLMLVPFLKQQIPEFKAGADHIQDHQGRAGLRGNASNLVYTYDPVTGAQSKVMIDNNRRVAMTDALARPASDIKRFVQVKEQAGEQWTWKDPFIQKTLSSLNPKDREAIKMEFDAENRRYNHWTEVETPRFLTDRNREYVAQTIIAGEPGMKATQARDLSQQLHDALALSKDPATAMQAVPALQQLGSQMRPETFASAVQLATGLIQDSEKHLSVMRNHPNYVNEQRYGDHQIKMVNVDGTPYRSSFASKDAALAKVKEKEAQGARFLEYIPAARKDVSGAMGQDVFQSLQELDQQATNRLTQALQGHPDILAQVLPEVQRAAQYTSSLRSSTPVPSSTPIRKFVSGREEINMIHNQNEFYVRLNGFMRHQLTRATLGVDMLDPEVMTNPAVKTLLAQHLENQLSADNPIVRKLNEITYHANLGFNFGVNFLHGIQSLTTGMASVISETGGVGDAFKLTGDATKAVVERYKNGKFTNPEHQWLVDSATARGMAGLASFTDIHDPDRAMMYDANSPTTTVGKGLNVLKNATRSWTNLFLRHNDMVGLISGFDLARSKGMTQEQAFQFASDMKDRGYYTGGKQQRAVGLWSIKSKAIPQLMSSLQTYTLGWFSQLSSNWTRGFGDAPKDITDSQRQGAKKAFVYQLAAQAVLAGALGLPGMGQGVALLKQSTGVDTKTWLRKNISQMFDEDQDNGGIMTNLALHGVVGSMTPMDPSGHHMISFPFTGVDPYKGFDIANFVPAPATTVSDFVQGLLSAAKGDKPGVAKALPHVLQGPWNLWAGEGDIRDKRGGLLYQLSPTERALQALGFSTSRINQAKDVAVGVKEANEQAVQQHEAMVDEIATTYRRDGASAAQQRMSELHSANPDLDGQSLAQSVAQRVEAQMFPFDPRLSANPAANLVGLPVNATPQLQQRLALRSKVQTDLGVAPAKAWSPRADYQASLMDSYMESDNTMSKATASSYAARKPLTAHPYSWPSQPTYQSLSQ